MKKWIIFLLGAVIIAGCFILEMITDKKGIVKYELQTPEYFEYKPKETKYYIDDEYELERFYELYSDALNIKVELLEDYDFFIEVRSAGSGSITYKLKDVKIYGNDVEFIVKENSPEIGTSDMAFWYLVAQIPKSKTTAYYYSEWVSPSSVFIDRSVDDPDYKFELNNKNKYVIETDLKCNTMMNDGGSHTNLYYNIDLDKNIVQKVREKYRANLGGTPSTTTEILYSVSINRSIKYKLKEFLEGNIVAGRPSSANYNFYTIISIDGVIEIYDLDTIEEIDDILFDIDMLD
jgi:hypothetical protein